jgi:hypothetical protein
MLPEVLYYGGQNSLSAHAIIQPTRKAARHTAIMVNTHDGGISIYAIRNAAPLRRRRRPMVPTPMKPKSIIAHVAGSGTAAATVT